jgi:tetratricopeptide (TPR) repeat protein
MAYGGWANAACVAVCRGDFDRALAYADRALTLSRGHPTLELQLLSIRAFLLWRLGRVAEAFRDSAAEREIAERLGVPELRAIAAHDAGLLCHMTGDHERAADLLGEALAGDPPIVRAETRLRRAEALARAGRPDEADAEIRLATQEPVRPSHRPAVLVARMAFAQALSARARGDTALAERRLEESAAQWRRLATERHRGADHLANLVDLGRPPITGVVDPPMELDRIAAELRDLPSVTV